MPRKKDDRIIPPHITEYWREELGWSTEDVLEASKRHGIDTERRHHKEEHKNSSSACDCGRGEIAGEIEVRVGTIGKKVKIKVCQQCMEDEDS